MSNSNDSHSDPSINVQVDDDVEGELNVAGRDVIIHKTTQVNLPFPTTIAGRALLGVGVLLLLTATSFGFGIPQKLGLIKPFPPAREDEILVIVADFTGEEAGATADRIFDTLARRVDESSLDHVRVERLEGDAPSNLREVEVIGEEYNASIVIWGRVDQFGFEPHYEVMEVGITYTVADLGVVTRDLPTFVARIVEDTPEEYEYLMLFSLGQLAFFSEDYDQAVTLFDEALDISLGNRAAELGHITLYMYRGASQYFDGDREAAMTNIMAAAGADRGLAATALGLPQTRSTEELTTSLAENPDDADLYVARALNAYIAGDFEAGLRDADQAIALDPAHSNAHVMRGLMVENISGSAAALADFDQAIEADPENATAYYARGFAYLSLDKLVESLVDHNRVLEIKPDLALAYLTRGMTHDFIGNRDAAIADFERFLELWPDGNPFAGLLRLGIIKLREEMP